MMWFLLLLLTAHFEQVITEEDYRLILENGGNPCEGFFRVYDGKAWGHVGCAGWSDKSDEVVCRSANCGKRVGGSEETSQEPVHPVLLNEVKCSGNEGNLWDCKHPGWGVNPYQKGTRRRVECSDKIIINLRGFPCAGIIQYSRDNGKTPSGYICRDNGFGEKEANHLCESLGCGEFKQWHDWIDPDMSGLKMVSINCPSNFDIKNLWQCAPKENSCPKPASVICKGYQRLQLKGDPSNVCAGQLEEEVNGEWKGVLKDSPDACKKMHCGDDGGVKGQNQNLTCKDKVKVVLMDKNKPSHCYGDVYIEKNGHPKAVCASKWAKEEAEVVCRELNCGTVISIDKTSSSEGGIMDNVQCSGKESSLWHCRAKHNNTQCSYIAYVICTGSVDVRLTDGPGKCAGRVEIQHAGQWKRVEEQGWTKDNSDAVCKQLDCGDKMKTNDNEFFSQGYGEFLEREVTCKENTKHISECIIGKSTDPSIKKKAVGITCEGHKVVVLKGEKSCSGMVGIEYNDKTKWLSGSTTWNQATANAVCRQKGCGEADTFNLVSRPNGSEVWEKSYNCSPNATSLFDCQEVPPQNETIASVTCKGTITVTLKEECWGTVEACVNGKCGGICAETWRPEMSKLLCESLGCGSNVLKPIPLPHSSEVKFKSLHTIKHKTNLNQCDFVEYGENDAKDCKPAYVVCSGSVKPSFEPSRDKCSGNVQVHYEGKWLPVCKDALVETQNTICEELQCGPADKVLEYFGPILGRAEVISQIECNDKDKKSLTACTTNAKIYPCILGGLQCSNWSKIEVTKGNRTCSGALHVVSKTDKRAVSLQGWTENEGKRLCQDLECGNYKSMNETSSAATQTTSFSCNPEVSHKNIWECEKTSLTAHGNTLDIECEDDFRLSLSKSCYGELMINNKQVCANDWIDEYSTMVCNHFGCGSAIPGLFSDKYATAGNNYYHVKCEENHHGLGHCKRFEGKCEGKLVSVYCAHSVTFRTAMKCGGQIEVKYGDKWEKVCPPTSFHQKSKEDLCKKIGCDGHNKSVENEESKPEAMLTTLNCDERHNDIRYCVEHKPCAKKSPAHIFCNGYVAPVVVVPIPQASPLVPILVGVGILLVVVILSVLFCIIKKRKKSINVPLRMFSRQEEEFGSGEFENIKENEMQNLNRGRFRSDAEVVIENDAPSSSSFPYDDVDEAQPLDTQTATPASENNYINEDGVTYEVEDPQENYDDIEASPEITQTEAEVHHSPQTTSERAAAEPLGLVMGDDDYLVPGQDG